MQRSIGCFRPRSTIGDGRRIAAAASAAALACIVAACGGGGESDTPRAGLRVDSEICPGVDLEKLSYLRVSSDGPPDGIWATVALAYDLGYRAVVVQHGLYQTTKTIDLSNGISLYGSCLFDGEPDRKYRTVIQASPPPGTPAILAHGANVTVSGVVVIGKDETANGAASVAMTAANANVTLRATVLVAGNGGPGGSRPPPLLSPAALRAGTDRCYTPGGIPNETHTWGEVDLGSLRWVAGIGGAGAGGGETGPGGVGGQQGGASIGLLLVNSAVVTTVPDAFNRIVGGFGGVGGAGQAGRSSFGLGSGANSGGAGGDGGPSIGVASINSAGVPSDGSYIYANAPGGPGAGGAAGVDAGQCSGDPGAPGVKGGSRSVYQLRIPNWLGPDETLAGGQSLYSPNLQFQLIMQTDGNLCLYDSGVYRWCSKTQGQEIYQAIMQTDGNFCMYEISGQFDFFCSGTAQPGDRLIVQDSGHAQVINTSGAVLWSVP